MRDCYLCKFYDLNGATAGRTRFEDGKSGACKRHAPAPLVGGSGQGWSDFEWPTVRFDDWCGEYVEREHTP